MGPGMPVPAPGDLSSSPPAPPALPPTSRAALPFPQMQTRSWPLPPWTRCWRASQGPGAPPALQVSTEGHSTGWSSLVTPPGLGLDQGALRGPVGGHGLGRALGLLQPAVA